jgi:hypothetical protein
VSSRGGEMPTKRSPHAAVQRQTGFLLLTRRLLRCARNHSHSVIPSETRNP